MPKRTDRHHQRRMLLILRNGRVICVELRVVGVLIASLARLAPEEAGHVGRQERGVIAAAARLDRVPFAPRTENSRSSSFTGVKICSKSLMIASVAPMPER